MGGQTIQRSSGSGWEFYVVAMQECSGAGWSCFAFCSRGAVFHLQFFVDRESIVEIRGSDVMVWQFVSRKMERKLRRKAVQSGCKGGFEYRT